MLGLKIIFGVLVTKLKDVYKKHKLGQYVLFRNKGLICTYIGRFNYPSRLKKTPH